ncbi:MFS transporter [Streptomyces sp. RFCAC02]|uniref:MFS transporter n=1 Tax=Streptomyces sp. RFCAC02 TaxID=2499143 RepID=UPI00102083C2|nr:MFS transporter [Streptomyces sp. RFCAC02]
MRSDPVPATPSLPSRRARALALAVVSTGTLMTVLDGSIVTVALPAIRDDLGFSPADLSWAVNAYLIPFGALLLLAGRLGDLIGRTRVFLAGIALFTVASGLAGLAGSPAVLLTARFLQGVGSALAAAVSLGILVSLFPGQSERRRAIAVYSFTGAAGASIGQVAGGLLTDAFGWHWTFLINLPIGIAALLIGRAVLPAAKGIGMAAGIDAPGALFVTGGLMLSIYAVVGADDRGWTSAQTLGWGALAAVLLVAFFVRQSRAATPLLPLRLLRSRAVAGANVVQLLTVAATFAFQVILALHLQNVLGYDATGTGIAMLPAAIMIGLVSLGVSARLTARFGERTVLLGGLLLLAGVVGLLIRVPADASYVRDVLPSLLLAGGFGLVLPTLAALGMSGARPDDAGIVSGLFATAQQVGSALGVAVVSTLAAARTDELLASGHDRADALAGGNHLAFGIATGLVVAAITVAYVTLRRPARVAALPEREHVTAA